MGEALLSVVHSFTIVHMLLASPLSFPQWFDNNTDWLKGYIYN